MAEAQGAEQDQSMEEILQSIKRIIAEEGDEVTEEASTKPANGSPVAGSTVLELTDVVREETVAPAPIPQMKPQPVAEAPVKDVLSELISEETVAASSAALKTLAAKAAQPKKRPPRTESIPFRSGDTVEDLVLEALRPMLKEWLDANLRNIVEELVEREVRKIAG